MRAGREGTAEVERTPEIAARYKVDSLSERQDWMDSRRRPVGAGGLTDGPRTATGLFPVLHVDSLRQGVGFLGNRDGQHAVAAARIDAVRIDAAGQRDLTVELPLEALDAMVVLLLLLPLLLALAAQGQGVVRHGYLDALRINTRQVGLDEVLLLVLLDVHARGPAGEPAVAARLRRAAEKTIHQLVHLVVNLLERFPRGVTIQHKVHGIASLGRLLRATSCFLTGGWSSGGECDSMGREMRTQTKTGGERLGEVLHRHHGLPLLS